MRDGSSNVLTLLEVDPPCSSNGKKWKAKYTQKLFVTYRLRKQTLERSWEQRIAPLLFPQGTYVPKAASTRRRLLVTFYSPSLRLLFSSMFISSLSLLILLVRFSFSSLLFTIATAFASLLLSLDSLLFGSLLRLSFFFLLSFLSSLYSYAPDSVITFLQ